MPDLIIRGAPILQLSRSAEIVIEGGVTSTNAPQLKDRIDAALDPKTAFISILMRSVSYVSSSGFGYLMDLANLVDRRGGAVCLVEVQPKVKVVFSNLGMQGFFRFEHSAEHARAFLRALAEKVARSPRVVPLSGLEEGVEFPIVGTSIRLGGDAKATICVKHPDVETRHCEIYRTGDQCSVRDLGSRSGTFVNERKVNDQVLHAGDIFRLGQFRVAYFPAGAKADPGQK